MQCFYAQLSTLVTLHYNREIAPCGTELIGYHEATANYLHAACSLYVFMLHIFANTSLKIFLVMKYLVVAYITT